MCGIAGIIRKTELVRRAEIETMCSLLQERGPDHQDVYLRDNVGIGHTRLSVIDLSTNAHQPMLNEDSSIVVSFNGEIYNFLFLKKELQSLGFTFRTNSDTEVLLNGFKAWGIEILLNKIDGMFAFALIDFNKGEVFFARDPFGKKPLYLYKSSNEWLFASSINSIYELKGLGLSINTNTIDYFLTELASPQPNTIWKEIEQLRPAHYLRLDMATWEVDEKRYWELKCQHDNYSEEEALELIENKLLESIKKRTVADVPIGCFLSGGIDSGLIASILASNSSEKIKTYSVGFGDPTLDELEDSRKVANRYNTDHHEIILDSGDIGVLSNLIGYIGEPFADMSMIPTYYISKYIGNHVKVALSGDGGDEMFGGYNDYLLSAESEFFDEKYGSTFIKSIAVLKDKIQSRFQRGRRNLGAYQEYSRLRPHQKLYRGIGFSYEEKNTFFLKSNTFCEDWLDRKWRGIKSVKSNTERLMLSSLETRLLNSYLVKVDRMSMMNSLEVRSPFLDKGLAKLAYSIPISLKFKGEVSKYLLKKLGEKYLDPDIQNRPKKGFTIPMHDWIQKNQKWVFEVIMSDKMTELGVLNRSKIEKQLMKSNPQNASKIWVLVSLGLWLDRYY